MPKPHVQSMDPLQDDSGHFVQGCLSLLSFRDSKLLNHDGFSKGLTWGVQDSSAASNPDKVYPLTGIFHSTWDIHTPIWSKAGVWSLLCRNYSTRWTDIWEQGPLVCFSGHAGSAFSSSQHPQVQSDHKFSITDTFCNFSVSFFEAGEVSAWFRLFFLSHWLESLLSFQEGSLCLFLSPYVLNNWRAKTP